MCWMRNGLAAVMIVTGTTALAETFDVAGIGLGETQSVIRQVTPRLTLVDIHTEYSGFEGRDPGNPLALVTGPCTGAVVIHSGSPTGTGVCHYTDLDSEEVVITWQARSMTADGRMQGTWIVEGGTGKWQEARGGGAFDSGVDGNGVYTNIVSGALTLK